VVTTPRDGGGTLDGNDDSTLGSSRLDASFRIAMSDRSDKHVFVLCIIPVLAACSYVV
jgi:hypothetical protein